MTPVSYVKGTNGPPPSMKFTYVICKKRRLNYPSNTLELTRTLTSVYVDTMPYVKERPISFAKQTTESLVEFMYEKTPRNSLSNTLELARKLPSVNVDTTTYIKEAYLIHKTHHSTYLTPRKDTEFSFGFIHKKKKRMHKIMYNSLSNAQELTCALTSVQVDRTPSLQTPVSNTPRDPSPYRKYNVHNAYMRMCVYNMRSKIPISYIDT